MCGTIVLADGPFPRDLSYAYPFASLSYIVMLIVSWQLFKEDIHSVRVLGSLVIGIGVFLISRS